MATIFTRIINGEIPSYKLAEDDEHFAFFDINPLAKGHTLVVPKREVDYLFDLEADELGRLFQFRQRVAKAIEANVKCERIGVAVIGLEVPHAHIHLVPINGIHDIDFSKPRVEMTEAQFLELASAVSAALNTPGWLASERTSSTINSPLGPRREPSTSTTTPMSGIPVGTSRRRTCE